MNVGIVSNTFDYEDDVKSGKKYIPVRFGQKNALRLIIIGTILAYLALISGVILDYIPGFSLISLATIPLAVLVILKTRQFNNASNYAPAMGYAIALTSLKGILLIFGYIFRILDLLSRIKFFFRLLSAGL
ncbi:MAG: prenyltransferase [Bacteroidota bacterium]